MWRVLLGPFACLALVSVVRASADAPDPVVINEVDWEKDSIELLNTSNTQVSLKGWSVCDTRPAHATAIGLGKCTAQATIPPHGFLVLERGKPCGFTFGLGSKDEVVLRDAHGRVVDRVHWDLKLPPNESFGRVPDGTGAFKPTTPTMGAPNKAASAAVRKLSAKLVDGASAIGAAVSEAPEPQPSLAPAGPAPAAPDALAAPDAKPPKAPKPSMEDKDGECCKLLASVGWTVDLPVVVIALDGLEDVPEAPKAHAQMCTCIGKGNIPEAKDYYGWTGISRRGSSSQRINLKKSFALKLETNTTKASTATPGPHPEYESVDFPMLGMPTEKHWALYGPELDKSLGLRNYMAYWAGRQTGEWAPRTEFVEVFVVRGANRTISQLDIGKDYEGIYLFLELVERGKHRVDVAPLDPAKDLSGGYIFKYDNDNISPGDVTFQPMEIGLTFIFKYPKSPVAQAIAWLKNYINELEDAMLAKTFADPQQGFRKYIDVPSFINYFLVVEWTKSPDGYRDSTYMHKDVGGKLHMGPLWDFNEAFGECCGYPIEGFQDAGQSGPGTSGGSAISTYGWRFNICVDPGRCKADPTDGVSQWYQRAWADDAFVEEVAQRWAELRAGPMSQQTVLGQFDKMKARINSAALRNGIRWKDRLLDKYWTSWPARWASETESMRSWLADHMEWMDKALQDEVTKRKAGTAVSPPSLAPAAPPASGPGMPVSAAAPIVSAASGPAGP